MGRRRTGGGKSAKKKGREIQGKREKRGLGSVPSCHESDNFFSSRRNLTIVTLFKKK